MQIAITFESLEELRAKLPELNALAGIKTCGGDCKHARPKDDQQGERFAFQRDERYDGKDTEAVREELKAAFAPAITPPPPPIMATEQAAKNAADSPFAPAFAPLNPTPAPAQSGDFAEAPPIDEGYRLIVKAKLATVNKLAGKNVARDLIHSITGCERLTVVPLDKLPDIMRAAEECEAALTGAATAKPDQPFTAARQY